ncbi:MAG: hypothetical protein IKP78_09610 [Ruminococcus sp.]|nr:hypothetical protein [Ruminococcus sp.]
MKTKSNRLAGHIGTALGALMFLALIPAGATLIYSLLTRDRSSDTVPLITFGLDIAFSVLTVALQGASIALLALFLRIGRRKGFMASCAFLFAGLLVNMLFAGMGMLLWSESGSQAVAYCLATGMMFLISTLFLSVKKCQPA